MHNQLDRQYSQNFIRIILPKDLTIGKGKVLMAVSRQQSAVSEEATSERLKLRWTDGARHNGGGLSTISALLWCSLDRGNQILSGSLRCSREPEKGGRIAACLTV